MNEQSLQAAKRALRQQVRASLAALSLEERTLLSQKLMERVEHLAAFRESRVVMAYSALPDEVQTLAALDRWLAMGKVVVLPVVVGDELEVRRYMGPSSLRSGAFGIAEPQGEPYTDLASIDLVIVPGRAFDQAGHRLGRGRGYYDRFLSRNELHGVHTLGLCFPCQFVPVVPTEPHDLSVDEVVKDV